MCNNPPPQCLDSMIVMVAPADPYNWACIRNDQYKRFYYILAQILGVKKKTPEVGGFSDWSDLPGWSLQQAECSCRNYKNKPTQTLEKHQCQCHTAHKGLCEMAWGKRNGGWFTLKCRLNNAWIWAQCSQWLVWHWSLSSLKHYQMPSRFHEASGRCSTTWCLWKWN